MRARSLGGRSQHAGLPESPANQAPHRFPTSISACAAKTRVFPSKTKTTSLAIKPPTVGLARNRHGSSNEG
jgi:hypothetical protein